MYPTSRHLCSQKVWNWSTAPGGIIPGCLTLLYATRKGGARADLHEKLWQLQLGPQIAIAESVI